MNKKRVHKYNKAIFVALYISSAVIFYILCVLENRFSSCNITNFSIKNKNFVIFLVVIISVICLNLFLGVSRNTANLLISALFPTAICVLVEYGMIVYVLPKFLVLFIFLCLLGFDDKSFMQNKRKYFSMLYKYSIKMFLILALVVICVANSFVIIGSYKYYNYKKTRNKAEVVVATMETETDKSTLDLDMNQMSNFQNIGYEDKLKLLYGIYNLEKQNLGISSDIDIIYSEIPPRESVVTLGYYNDEDSKIVLNADRLDTFEETLSVLLHEIFHVYQNECVEIFEKLNEETELAYYKEISTYKNEMQSYKSAYDESSFDDYSNQTLEKNARDYADNRIEDFYNVYLKKK